MVSHSFTDFVRSCDLFFYAPVQFKYKGSGKYRTVLGGSLSLLVLLIVIFYLPGRMLHFLRRDFTFVSSHSVYHNLEDSLGRVSGRDL